MKLFTLCYVRANGKTLMIYRNKKPNDVHEGKWNGLGGKFEPGETPEECVIREVQEETGLLIKKPLLKGILTFPFFYDGEDAITFVFTADEFEGVLMESHEGDLSWIADSDILNLNLWGGDKIFIPLLRDKKIFSGKFLYLQGKLENHSVVFHEYV